MLGGLKGVKFHGEFNYATLRTLTWCVFKRSQKNCFFRPKTAIFGQKIGSSNLLGSLKEVKFHGKLNYASLMTLKWCVFKRTQKNCFFRPKTAIFGQKIGSSYLLRGLRRVKFHGESNYASPMALKWCVFKRSQKKPVF